MEQIGCLNHKYIRAEVEVRTETIIRDTIRIGTIQITGQIAEIEDNTNKAEVGLDMDKIMEEVILEET